MSRQKKEFHPIEDTYVLLIFIMKIMIHSIPFTLKILKKIIFIVKNLFVHANKKCKRLFIFSITFKITVVYAFIFSCLLFFSSIFIFIGFKVFLHQNTRVNFQRTNDSILRYMKDFSQSYTEKINTLSKQENVSITLFDENKKRLHFAGSDRKSFKNKTNVIFTETIDTNELLTLNNKVQTNGQTFYIQITKKSDPNNGYVEVLMIFLFFFNAISIFITLLYGWRISKKMLLPIKDMTDIAKKISIQNLDTRLNVSGSKDELKELAETFNEMVDRIQESYEKQHQFVSDASHELRTPIAVIQGYANLLDRWGKNDKSVLEESIEAIKSESENMKDLVEKLLFLARSDKRNQNMEKEDFFIDELIHEIAKETRMIDSKHEILTNTKENLLLHGDRKLIKQALRIFIDNSIKFTPEKGKIILGCDDYKNHIFIFIEDTGQGIPAEDLPYIFHRFYRADKSRTKEKGGHGLGLSIAKWIIDQHNGMVQAKSTLHVGTKISVVLPKKV